MAQKRRRRKPLTLEKVRASLSTALINLEAISLNSPDPDLRIRACNSMATVANSFAKITETTDIQIRISKIEEALHEQQH